MKMQRRTKSEMKSLENRKKVLKKLRKQRWIIRIINKKPCMNNDTMINKELRYNEWKMKNLKERNKRLQWDIKEFLTNKKEINE